LPMAEPKKSTAPPVAGALGGAVPGHGPAGAT